MGEASLVDDVALGLPLPDDQLVELFDAQGKPGAGLVDGDGAYFVSAD